MQFNLSFFNGDQNNNEITNVIHSIRSLLNTNDTSNYFLIPNPRVSDGTETFEADLILMHGLLGIYVIRIVNWESLSYLHTSSNPFTQVKQSSETLMSIIEKKLGKIPVNIEYRVIFPNISKDLGKSFFGEFFHYSEYSRYAFFKESFISASDFSGFFYSSTNMIPTASDFLDVTTLIMTRKLTKKDKESIVPVITRDEIAFFDYKQMSILNDYKSGFRVIRGVAGTGKTIILTNFVKSILDKKDAHILVLCYNKKLEDNLNKLFFDDMNISNDHVSLYSLLQLLKRIQFNYQVIGGEITSENFNEQHEKLKSPEATKEFRTKLAAVLHNRPKQYFICDETQDLPPNFVRVIHEFIKNSILFIDEAQTIYSFSMKSIQEVFHHPEFEQLDMRGRVRNLYNVYRSPSNIARCAFEILSCDPRINNYYKKMNYLNKTFLDDVNFILESGNIYSGNYERYKNLNILLQQFPKEDEVIILTHYKQDVDRMNPYLLNNMAEYNITAMTYASVKGLEADHVILHNFETYLKMHESQDMDLLFRKAYVILTRARKNIYLSLTENNGFASSQSKIIVDTIMQHQINSDNFDLSKSVTQETDTVITRLFNNIQKYPNNAEIIDTIGTIDTYVSRGMTILDMIRRITSYL